jgi:hypothetical protein
LRRLEVGELKLDRRVREQVAMGLRKIGAVYGSNCLLGHKTPWRQPARPPVLINAVRWAQGFEGS